MTHSLPSQIFFEFIEAHSFPNLLQLILFRIYCNSFFSKSNEVHFFPNLLKFILFRIAKNLFNDRNFHRNRIQATLWSTQRHLLHQRVHALLIRHKSPKVCPQKLHVNLKLLKSIPWQNLRSHKSKDGKTGGTLRDGGEIKKSDKFGITLTFTRVISIKVLSRILRIPVSTPTLFSGTIFP